MDRYLKYLDVFEDNFLPWDFIVFTKCCIEIIFHENRVGPDLFLLQMIRQYLAVLIRHCRISGPTLLENDKPTWQSRQTGTPRPCWPHSSSRRSAPRTTVGSTPWPAIRTKLVNFSLQLYCFLVWASLYRKETKNQRRSSADESHYLGMIGQGRLIFEDIARWICIKIVI